MKNSRLTFTFLMIGIICLSDCKKKDKPKDEEPEIPAVVTNPPPATGDYWLTTKGTTAVYWTQDFETYHELSTDLKGDYIYVSGDTALITGYSDFTVKFGLVSNPGNFKTVSSSKKISDAGYIHGYIVVLSTDGNNKYLGRCNVKKGETAIQYTFLTNNESFMGFYRINNLLITNISTSLGTTMGSAFVSNDSLKWMPAPSPVSNVPFRFFDGGNGVTVAYIGNVYWTSATDFNSATWATKSIYNTNTSDSSGSFTPYEIYPNGFVNINGKWKIYGMIEMTSNGHKIPAVNTSSDLGASWQRILLSGITYSTTLAQNFTYRSLVSKNATFIVFSNNNGSNSIAYVYKSSDGINFTKFREGVEAENFYEQSPGAVYVK